MQQQQTKFEVIFDTPEAIKKAANTKHKGFHAIGDVTCRLEDDGKITLSILMFKPETKDTFVYTQRAYAIRSSEKLPSPIEAKPKKESEDKN
jgi:hypothetical protein